ncbi:histidinol dehydrogenase [Candidatus Bathyarchaeota archaeon]|nr:MAG: histidinol dehydrogenase [Candidatus Bathyarchaeota archaeon]
MNNPIRILTCTPKKLLERRRELTSDDLKVQVLKVIEAVKKKGDSAILEFTEKFDGVKLSAKDIKVSNAEIEDAYEKVTGKQVTAIETLKERLKTVEGALLERINFKVELDGVTIYSQLRPIGRVGCYVPGGLASYPSTVVMTVTPAKVAGVREICICTPPRKKGDIHPLTLVAADICGVQEIYRVGGAQAIAAMAYGTETIKPVDKIVGPGGIYVTTAKLIVSKDVAIDFPAGPTEIAVLADEYADPRLIALDMISQAEHGVSGYSILVTDSFSLANRVRKEIEEMLRCASRKDIIQKALNKNGLILVLEDLDRCISFINEFAPEHVEVMVKNPNKIARKIENAGVILLGKYSPVAASDYCLGVNHVLPTGGFSKTHSGLSALDFTKRINVVKCSRDGLLKVKEIVEVLARSEGLINHSISVEGRFIDG